MRPHDVVGGPTVLGNTRLPIGGRRDEHHVAGFGEAPPREESCHGVASGEPRHGRDTGIIPLVDDDSAGQIYDVAGHRGGPIRGHERGRFGELRQRGRTFAVRLRGHGGREFLPGDVVCLGVQPETTSMVGVSSMPVVRRQTARTPWDAHSAENARLRASMDAQAGLMPPSNGMPNRAGSGVCISTTPER